MLLGYRFIGYEYYSLYVGQLTFGHAQWMAAQQMLYLKGEIQYPRYQVVGI